MPRKRASDLIVTKEMIEKSESLAARGLTIEEIADCLGMKRTALYEKKKENQDLAEAIKRGRSKGISIISNSLYESAKNGNTTAQIFYLKCRAHWKETNVTEIGFPKQQDILKDLE